MKNLVGLLLLIMPLICFTQDITSDLIAHLPFSNDLTDEASDSDVEIVGNPTFVEDRFGYPDCALRFGPGNNHITMIDNGDNQIGNDRPFTVSLWYKLSSQDVAQDADVQHLLKKECPNYPLCFEIALFDIQQGLIGDHTWSYGLWMTEDCYGDLEQLNDTTVWNHLVAIVDDNMHPSLYLNDIFCSQDTNYALDIGDPSGNYIFGENFYGSIDDVRIYDRALNETEIHELFNLNSECFSSVSDQESQSILMKKLNDHEWELSAEGDSKILIYTIDGRQLLKDQFYMNYRLNMNRFMRNSIYLIKIQSRTHQRTFKISY